MAWWEQVSSYLQDSGLDEGRAIAGSSRLKSLKELLSDAFFEETIDILYFWLGIFTYLYFFTVALLYLGALSNAESVATKLTSSLAEPYLGAVGIYVILKESRKRKHRLKSRHWGELFVGGWLTLLAFSSTLAFFFKAYTFNHTLEEIITISVAVGIIYMGSAVHKP